MIDPKQQKSLSLRQECSPASATEGDAYRGPTWLVRRAGYFRLRWSGKVPLAKVFWNDMVLVGTIVNVITTLLAMVLFIADALIILVVMTFFSPIPFNIFLFVSVWRSADSATGTNACVARIAALAWFFAVTAL